MSLRWVAFGLVLMALGVACVFAAFASPGLPEYGWLFWWGGAILLGRVGAEAVGMGLRA